MTLRIERDSDGDRAVLRLIGQLGAQDLGELKGQIEVGVHPIVLDLDELSLVDVNAVRFLKSCQQRGVELINCPPYIREWIRREEVKG
jgi:anti-anti-sigma regulatory factor